MKQYILPVILSLALIGGFAAHQRSIGRAQAETRIAKEQAEKWQKISAARDSIHRVELTEMANEILKYQNLLGEAKVTDTVWVKKFIVTSDATIKKCHSVVVSCELRVASRDSTIIFKDKQIKALLKTQGGDWKPWAVAGAATVLTILQMVF